MATMSTTSWLNLLLSVTVLRQSAQAFVLSPHPRVCVAPQSSSLTTRNVLGTTFYLDSLDIPEDEHTRDEGDSSATNNLLTIVPVESLKEKEHGPAPFTQEHSNNGNAILQGEGESFVLLNHQEPLVEEMSSVGEAPLLAEEPALLQDEVIDTDVIDPVAADVTDMPIQNLVGDIPLVMDPEAFHQVNTVAETPGITNNLVGDISEISDIASVQVEQDGFPPMEQLQALEEDEIVMDAQDITSTLASDASEDADVAMPLQDEAVEEINTLAGDGSEGADVALLLQDVMKEEEISIAVTADELLQGDTYQQGEPSLVVAVQEEEPKQEIPPSPEEFNTLARDGAEDADIALLLQDVMKEEEISIAVTPDELLHGDTNQQEEPSLVVAVQEEEPKQEISPPPPLKKVLPRKPFWAGVTVPDISSSLVEALTPVNTKVLLKEKDQMDVLWHTGALLTKAALGTSKAAMFASMAVVDALTDKEVNEFTSATVDSAKIKNSARVFQSVGSTVRAVLNSLGSSDSSKHALEAVGETTRSLVSASAALGVLGVKQAENAKNMLEKTRLAQQAAEQARIEEEKRIAEEILLEKKRIAAEKLAEEKRIAAEKLVEEKRIAAEKLVEEKRIAAEKLVLEQLHKEAEEQQRRFEKEQLAAQEAALEKIRMETEQEKQKLAAALLKNPDAVAESSVKDSSAKGLVSEKFFFASEV